VAVVPVDAGSVRRVRVLPGSAVASLVLTAVAFAALARGAYHGPARAVVLVVVAAAVATCGIGWSAVRSVRAPVLGALALAASAALSGLAAGTDTGALPTILLLATLAGVVVVVAALGRAAHDHLVSGLAVAATAVAATGMYGVATHRFPLAIESQGLWRAAGSITYANATGALLVLAALALAGRAVARRSVADVIGLTVLLAGAGATLSRAAGLALVLGVVVLAVLSGPGRVARTLAPAALGAAVAVGGLLPSIAGAPRPALAVAGLIGGIAVAVGATRVRAAVVLTIALAIGALVVTSPALDRIDDTRATTSSSDRIDQWRAAWRAAVDHPVLGVGPELPLVYVASDGRGLVRATWAHNEYLQLAAEQGVIGVGALGVAAAATARTVLRRRRRAGGAWAGSVAALVAFAAHSGFDFLWQVPVLPLAAAVLLGIALFEETP